MGYTKPQFKKSIYVISAIGPNKDCSLVLLSFRGLKKPKYVVSENVSNCILSKLETWPGKIKNSVESSHGIIG